MTEPSKGAVRFGCPSCGGGLRWDLDAHKLKCQMCGREFDPESIAAKDSPPAADDVEVTAFQCPQCGAQIVSGSSEATSFCSYCGSDVVLVPRLTRMRRPDLILPFTVDRSGCEAKYREYLAGCAFAPSRLKRQETIRNFRPIYIPFWAYTVQVEGPQRVIILQTNGSSRDTSRVEMDVSFRQENILYDASVAFEDETAARLGHSLNGAVPFVPSYLSGVYAQAPDVAPEVYEAEARASAMLNLAETLRSRLHATQIRFDTSKDEDTEPVGETERKLVLLPVWMLASRRGDRVLYTAVNGRDGQVVCDPPVSYVKVGLLAGAIAAVLFVLLMLLGTIPIHGVTAIASLIAAFSLRMIVPIYCISLFREMRAGEPQFEKTKVFRGQAQRRLMELQRNRALGVSGAEKAKMTGAQAGVFALRFILSLGFRVLGMLASVVIPLLIRTITDYWFIIPLIVAAVIGIVTAGKAVRWMRDLPPSRDKSRFGTLLVTAYVLVAAMMLVSVINPAEDLIYHLLVIATLSLTSAMLVLFLRWRNRFAGRPSPFFGEVSEDA